jgi:CheY-like chemotaxis protein
MSTVPQQTRARRVLVVEDEPAVRSLLAMVLEAESYDVETAGDGYEALGKLPFIDPDVILLDLALPGLDGTELIHALRADPATCDVPIVCMSARYGLLTAMDFGVQGFVPKPFDTAVLLDILANVLREPAPSVT